MRILMATMQLDIGGAETHIVELSKALKKRGVEVFIASNGGSYVKELEDAGIPHFKVALNRKSIFSMHKAYKSLKRIIDENSIDIIHAHARIPGFLCGLLQKKYKYRFVTTAHWVFKTAFPFNLLSNWGERSLAVSDDIKDYLICNYGIPDENILTTINGVDTNKFSPDIDFSDIAKEFSFGFGKKRIVYVSRMDTDRSFAAHKLIEAVPDLYNKIPELEVVIVGGGNDFKAIKTEAESMNKRLGANILITTGPRIDINKFVASCDVFVGVSRAALEAMAAKKPAIIAGNEGYIGIFDESKLRVAIDTNFCCRGCGETTAQKLRDDILSILEDDKSANQKALGEYSFDTVMKYYSVDTMAADALKMYISVIKGSLIGEVDDQKEFPGIEKYLLQGNSRRDIDVMLSGYYGFGNNGDDSILSAIISSLRERCPNIKIMVLSKNPEETARLYSVDTADRFDFFVIKQMLKRTKLLISGGGSLLQDITSTKSLYYYLMIIRMAKKAGAKVMVFANGIGPITKKKNIKRVKNNIKYIDAITLRESSSLRELKRIAGRDVSARVTADPVFTVDIPEGNHIDEVIARAGIEPGQKFFVITVRDWNSSDRHIERKIAEFSNYVFSKYNIVPFIVPMQSKFDRDISEDIDVRLSFPHGVCRNSYHHDILMGIIARAEFVLGMRFHSLVYAVKAGVPSIALDYDPKVASFMETLQMKYKIKVENIDVEKLCSFADEILENRTNLRAELLEKEKGLEILAEENINTAIELIKTASR